MDVALERARDKHADLVADDRRAVGGRRRTPSCRRRAPLLRSVTWVGAIGAPTVTDALDWVLVPRAFLAATLKVYVLALARPTRVALVTVGLKTLGVWATLAT